ncbi:hypothetical protein SALBM311S_03085 [Streptomyces alboniger]
MAAQQRAVAAQFGVDAADAGEACRPVSSTRPRRSDQYGARAVWALPVTGSSSMPTFGKKQRETKS